MVAPNRRIARACVEHGAAHADDALNELGRRLGLSLHELPRGSRAHDALRQLDERDDLRREPVARGEHVDQPHRGVGALGRRDGGRDDLDLGLHFGIDLGHVVSRGGFRRRVGRQRLPRLEFT